MVGGAPRKVVVLALLVMPGVAFVGSTPASGSEGEPVCSTPDTPSAQMELPAFDAAVVNLINQQRAAAGLKPLRPNPLLHDAAWIYTTSMLSGQFFTHHGSVDGVNNGSTVIGRLRFLGYIPPGKRWIVGEDLREARLPTDTPSCVVQAWMESPEHRERILNRKFEEIGVDAERGIADEFPNVTGVTVAAEFGFRRFPKKKK
jgi:uncharacterized protein YkwD